jgi:protein-disulfide isomerase
MRFGTTAALVVLAAGLAGCSRSPSPQELEKTLNEHPEILYRVIQKHPGEFIDALNKALVLARQQQGNASQEQRQEAEFRNPKLPVISDRRAVRGDVRAPVTIVEYTDFQCPYCRREHQVLQSVLAKYTGRVRLVIKQTPLDNHAQAMPAAQMFEAIAMQSPEAAWRFHDDLFDNAAALQERGPAYIVEAAQRTGVDMARAVRDANGPEVRATIEQDRREAAQFGFSGTPGVLINGVSFDGAYPQEDLEKVIDRHLAGRGRE